MYRSWSCEMICFLVIVFEKTSAWTFYIIFIMCPSFAVYRWMLPRYIHCDSLKQCLKGTHFWKQSYWDRKWLTNFTRFPIWELCATRRWSQEMCTRWQLCEYCYCLLTSDLPRSYLSTTYAYFDSFFECSWASFHLIVATPNQTKFAIAFLRKNIFIVQISPNIPYVAFDGENLRVSASVWCELLERQIKSSQFAHLPLQHAQEDVPVSYWTFPLSETDMPEHRLQSLTTFTAKKITRH